ncbi:hypothetical protein M011DRAFT_485475 [Sporormia fimetaria CBS 119925]|uniref:Uncharacterized protein n=1 Tax=Sporormia fimetaria CBS 119925 TaxID=1340428 RepID=A0A6A6VHY3_9PLEO|nr:hypothetical protein M011DRAFT_485475 [Sporormia fimetaria CBS 119925]
MSYTGRHHAPYNAEKCGHFLHPSLHERTRLCTDCLSVVASRREQKAIKELEQAKKHSRSVKGEKRRRKEHEKEFDRIHDEVELPAVGQCRLCNMEANFQSLQDHQLWIEIRALWENEDRPWWERGGSWQQTEAKRQEDPAATALLPTSPKTQGITLSESTAGPSSSRAGPSPSLAVLSSSLAGQSLSIAGPSTQSIPDRTADKEFFVWLETLTFGGPARPMRKRKSPASAQVIRAKCNAQRGRHLVALLRRHGGGWYGGSIENLPSKLPLKAVMAKKRKALTPSLDVHSPVPPLPTSLRTPPPVPAKPSRLSMAVERTELSTSPEPGPSEAAQKRIEATIGYLYVVAAKPGSMIGPDHYQKILNSDWSIIARKGPQYSYREMSRSDGRAPWVQGPEWRAVPLHIGFPMSSTSRTVPRESTTPDITSIQIEEVDPDDEEDDEDEDGDDKDNDDKDNDDKDNDDKDNDDKDNDDKDSDDKDNDDKANDDKEDDDKEDDDKEDDDKEDDDKEDDDKEDDDKEDDKDDKDDDDDDDADRPHDPPKAGELNSVKLWDLAESSTAAYRGESFRTKPGASPFSSSFSLRGGSTAAKRGESFRTKPVVSAFASSFSLVGGSTVANLGELFRTKPGVPAFSSSFSREPEKDDKKDTVEREQGTGAQDRKGKNVQVTKDAICESSSTRNVQVPANITSEASQSQSQTSHWNEVKKEKPSKVRRKQKKEEKRRERGLREKERRERERSERELRHRELREKVLREKPNERGKAGDVSKKDDLDTSRLEVVDTAAGASGTPGSARDQVPESARSKAIRPPVIVLGTERDLVHTKIVRHTFY